MFGNGSKPESQADELAEAREAMVRDQLERRGINDPRVLAVMREVPRHAFVPAELQAHAYDDRPLAIGSGQTISQPYMVALMTQMLRVSADDRVLEVGTGSGYQAAVLAGLAKRVVTVERHEALARHAAKMLDELGITNVAVHVGDGTLGWPDDAPYNGILVTAAGPRVPPSLRAQLAQGGRLVCPVGTRKVQHIVRYRRVDDELIQEEGIGCVFVPLIGREGWHERPASSG